MIPVTIPNNISLIIFNFWETYVFGDLWQIWHFEHFENEVLWTCGPNLVLCYRKWYFITTIIIWFVRVLNYYDNYRVLDNGIHCVIPTHNSARPRILLFLRSNVGFNKNAALAVLLTLHINTMVIVRYLKISGYFYLHYLTKMIQGYNE